MNTLICKVLEFKGDRKIFGRFAMPIDVGQGMEWGGCEIPQLMNVETTIAKLQNLYPTLNFKDVKLTTVRVTELETNQA